MKPTKKILALVLAIALVAGVSISATTAYLKDEDSTVNVMTLGSVRIRQIEQQLAADGSTLEPFRQAKDLYPGSSISKIVTVENTGKSDAYFRTLIAFETVDSKTFGINFPIDDLGPYRWSWGKPEAIIEVDGVTYEVYEALYTKALSPGEVSAASLTKVELAVNATNEDMEALGETYDILVLSQAAQTEGFADAGSALEAAFGKTSEKAAEWFGGMKVGTVVSNADELVEALTGGKSVILANDITVTETVDISTPADIDLNGYELTVSHLEAKADTKISNGTLTHGKCSYPAVSVSAGTMELDSVEINCPEHCTLNTNASGTAEATEYVGIQVWGGKLIMNDTNITVTTDKLRYSNTVIGIGINGGEVIMNGGSIVLKNHGSTKPQYDYETVIFASGNADKAITLSNVAISTRDNAKYLYAWGGHTTLNTTDHVPAEKVNTRNGGTYTIQ